MRDLKRRLAAPYPAKLAGAKCRDRAGNIKSLASASLGGILKPPDAKNAWTAIWSRCQIMGGSNYGGGEDKCLNRCRSCKSD
jgi:hypothetical protein